MFTKNKYNSSTQYTITWDMSYVSAGQDHIRSYVVKDVCVHNPVNINNWECVTKRPITLRFVITAVWACTGEHL